MSLLFLVLFQCAGSQGTGEASGAIDQAAAVPAEEAVAPTELVIDPAVLRDLRITTSPVATASGDEGASFLGELVVDESRYAEVGVPVAARVRKLLAEPGDEVSANAPLIELESAELGQARAALLGARARVEQATRSLERKRALAGGAVSTREVEATEGELAAATADASAAEALVASFGAGSQTSGGAAFTLRAPIAGVVLSREAHQGEVVDPERVLFRIADLSHLWLVVHAFERDAVRAREGRTADVTFAALPNRTFQGAVTRVGREVDPVSRTVPIRIEIDNADGVLRPGMSATARMPLGSGEGVVAVPTIAIQRCEAGWCVFVPKEPGHFEVRPVGRGRDIGSQAEILSGVQAGETVVVDGAFLLRA
jgi:cobalt-zinc-cadmium efflux system membrane fusion protein